MDKLPVSEKKSKLNGRIISELFIVTAACLSIFSFLMNEFTYSYSYISRITHTAQVTAASEADIQERIIVNINTAEVDELMTLEGIGEVTAQEIITYRKKNNGFLTIDELLEVDGIGEAKLEKIRNYVTVE